MSCYTNLLSGSPEYRSVVSDIEKKRFPFGCLGLPPTPKALMIHTLCDRFSRGALVITPDEAAATKLAADLTTPASSPPVISIFRRRRAAPGNMSKNGWARWPGSSPATRRS